MRNLRQIADPTYLLNTTTATPAPFTRRLISGASLPLHAFSHKHQAERYSTTFHMLNSRLPILTASLPGFHLVVQPFACHRLSSSQVSLCSLNDQNTAKEELYFLLSGDGLFVQWLFSTKWQPTSQSPRHPSPCQFISPSNEPSLKLMMNAHW